MEALARSVCGGTDIQVDVRTGAPITVTHSVNQTGTRHPATLALSAPPLPSLQAFHKSQPGLDTVCARLYSRRAHLSHVQTDQLPYSARHAAFAST